MGKNENDFLKLLKWAMPYLETLENDYRYNPEIPADELDDLVQLIYKLANIVNVTDMVKPKQRPPFTQALESLINQYSEESNSNTPDFVLATYLSSCLAAFNLSVNDREKWYGRPSYQVPAKDQKFPDLIPGLMFAVEGMSCTTCTVVAVNEDMNLLSVDIDKGNGNKWHEDGWNLEHTRWAFERGEYWIIDIPDRPY